MMFSSPHIGNVLTRKVSRTMGNTIFTILEFFFVHFLDNFRYYKHQNSDFKFAKGSLTTIYKIHNQGAGIRPGQ